MQKLAKAAHVSPATIYIYHKNKEDLLNTLYNYVHETFTNVALTNFHPDLSLEDGLMLQWKNRLRFITDYPMYYKFTEQFKHSPLIHHKDIRMDEFKENMMQFVMNAIRRGELKRMEAETFWAIAYGAFYALVRFHIHDKSMMSDHYQLTDARLRNLLQFVLKALKP